MANQNDVSFVLESLNQLLEQDADLLTPRMEDQLRLLLSHLRQILYFLRCNQGTQEALNSARKLVYDAETHIHLLAVNVAKHRIRGGLGRIVHVCGHKMMLRRASSSLENILKKIQDEELHCGSQDTDQIEGAGGSGSLHKVALGNTNGYPELLAFGNDVEDLVSKLTNVSQTSHQVISIFGRAGSGKMMWMLLWD